eukprot:2643631-Pyramimonas_sp.AAC.1
MGSASAGNRTRVCTVALCLQAYLLKAPEMDELWEYLGGDERYAETKMSQLLCRYRSGMLAGEEDPRLK